MAPYQGKWTIMIGFKGEHLAEIEPIIETLQEDYPDTEWNCMNSKFPQYDFILCGFAGNRDDAHKIGMAVVKKHMPQHLNLLYWVKEVGVMKYNVEEKT